MRTAVEWLTHTFYANEGIMKSEWLEQAKEMEKQQIVHAWNDGLWGKLREGEDNAESYYTETFKSE